MGSISLSDEKGGISLFSGMVLAESDIDALRELFNRLLDKVDKPEKHAPTPEGTRLNILEYSHDTLWKAQIKTKKQTEEVEGQVIAMSRRLDMMAAVHTRIYKEIDEHKTAIERMDYKNLQDEVAGRKQDKRLSDIEEFIGDI